MTIAMGPLENSEDSFSTRLRDAYSSDLVLRQMFDEFSRRERNRRITNIEWVVNTFLVMRSEATRAFKVLEAIGCGAYREGRGKNPSRFEWTMGTIYVARVACGLSEAEEQTPAPAQLKPRGNLIVRRFELRADLELEFAVPQDMSRREAERIGSFLAAFVID